MPTLHAIGLANLWSLLPLAAQTPPTRIMPLGDSITDGTAYGAAGFGGYRGTLDTLLTSAGYNVDFVGTQTNNGENIPDHDHEGHSGWQIGQLDSNIAGWFNAIAPPDVVLMHIGTNDFGGGNDTPNAINRLDALILKIATLRPYAHIVVTNIMERAEPLNASIQSQFNPFVQARVNAHAAAGRRVTFLDMRAACPLADMPDQLHPNQTGYDKMAGAWRTAVQAVMTPLGDNLPPGLALVAASDNTHVAVTFSKPVEDAATTLANFSIAGLNVSAATLDATSKRVVTLTTSPMTAVASYTLAVSGVRDRTAAAHPIAPGTTANFYGPAIRGAVNNVAEAANYTLLYSLNLPSAAAYNNTPPVYDIDNRIGIGPFTRVAYYLELQLPGQPLQYCWVSMNPFTSNSALLGVPHLASGAFFQQPVANMNVVSNVPGVVNGSALAGGNIEFWSTNYTMANSVAVPGASAATYDFGDEPVAGGYGSMQVHNSAAAQTLIAFNRWGAVGDTFDLGIGNSPGANPDWTFATNAAAYTIRALQVFVKTADDLTGPVLSTATASPGRTKITVTFNEPLAESSAAPQNFTLTAGVTVLSATLRANLRTIALTVTSSPPGTPLTLTVSGVRDRSPNANLIAPASSIAVTALTTLPAIITGNVPESGDYQLACQLDIPTTQPDYHSTGTPYTIDNRASLPGFDRVAYFLELATGGTTTFVWVSGDAFTASVAKIAVPDLPSGAFFQQAFGNMNVVSNAAGIANGSGFSGWLEFWPSNYAQANAASVPGASASLFDFGDQAGAGAGYGSMQVHNPAAAQTLFAFNRWGVAGSAADLGIGNRPTADPDWTFAVNAAGYTTRRLYVLVRSGDTAPSGPTVAPVVVSHPTSRSVSAGTATTFLAAAAGTSPFGYQWRRNAVPIPGATAQTFTIPNVQAVAIGSYDALITNPAGTATSLAGSLAVTGLTENPLSLRAKLVSGIGTVINYSASPKQPFILQRSTNLLQWINQANLSADAAGEWTYTDPNPPTGRAFYRLLRVNP